MKGTLKKIVCNCRQATVVIGKRQAGSTTIPEKLALKIRPGGCPVCRIFERRGMQINKLVHDLFHNAQVMKFTKLDDDFKKKMHDQIMEKLEKN